MDKIMTKHDIQSNNFMGVGARGVNAVGIGSTSLEERKFEDLYNKEVNILVNQGGGYLSN